MLEWKRFSVSRKAFISWDVGGFNRSFLPLPLATFVFTSFSTVYWEKIIINYLGIINP